MARFSEDRIYRYALWRQWSGAPYVAFIGLNPSTADEIVDDNTLRRCLGYAAAWGDVGGIVMLNLFAFRATKPRDMRRADEPVARPENDQAIKQHCRSAKLIVCCWGRHGRFKDRDCEVLGLLAGRELLCFGQNFDGTPKHPLYLSKATKLRPFKN